MNPNRITASTSRLAVSWLGRLNTVAGRRGVVIVDMGETLCRLANPDGPRHQVVAVGAGDPAVDEVAGLQAAALEPDDAVDVRRVAGAAGEHVPGHLRVGPVHDQLDLLAHLPRRVGEGDFLLD